MSSPTTRLAYIDCFEIYDKALEDSRGIRLHLPSESAAINLRMRMHMARQIDRNDNRRLHPPTAPLYAASVYDPLQIRIREDHDGFWWVYVEQRSTPIIGEIESLSEIEDLKWLEQNSPQKLISHTGNEPLQKKLEYASSAPIEPSSSTPSIAPEKSPATPLLRRL